MQKKLLKLILVIMLNILIQRIKFKIMLYIWEKTFKENTFYISPNNLIFMMNVSLNLMPSNIVKFSQELILLMNLNLKKKIKFNLKVFQTIKDLDLLILLF